MRSSAGICQKGTQRLPSPLAGDTERLKSRRASPEPIGSMLRDADMFDPAAALPGRGTGSGHQRLTLEIEVLRVLTRQVSLTDQVFRDSRRDIASGQTQANRRSVCPSMSSGVRDDSRANRRLSLPLGRGRTAVAGGLCKYKINHTLRRGWRWSAAKD